MTSSRVTQAVRVAAIFGLVALLVGVGPAPAGAGAVDPVPEGSGRLLVHGGRAPSVTGAGVSTAGDDEWWVVDPGDRDLTSLEAELRDAPGVVEVRPELVYHAARVPDDPCFRSGGCGAVQWYLDAIGAPRAWDVTQGDPDVVVAVLDSGIRATHQDLAGQVVDLTACGDESLPTDDETHGTSVSSLVGAATDDGVGLAGLGWSVKMAEARVLFRRNGELIGNEADIAQAVRCVTNAGADVINMSFVGPPSALLEAAVADAAAAGIVLVAAAGNGGDEDQLYPAAYEDVIAVAATREDGALAGFSSRGSWVDMAAPGDSVVAAAGHFDADYEVVRGTSFSAPLVSAAAALLVSEHPDWTPLEIRARLLRTAVPLDGSGGLLDAGAALTSPRAGYWLLTETGWVAAFGDAVPWGSPPEAAAGLVGMASAPDGRGYSIAAADGGVFAFGSAGFFGSMGGKPLNSPIVGIAATQDGRGYWLVAADGGVFAFGSAGFFGSMGGKPLNSPVVGIAATPDGLGYWLVAADGGVFAFGSAGFFGSMGSVALVAPVFGVLATATGSGYSMVARDGGVFTFGDATFYGSSGGALGVSPIEALLPVGGGYLLAASDGTIQSFGAAESFPGVLPPDDPVIAGAAFR